MSRRRPIYLHSNKRKSLQNPFRISYPLFTSWRMLSSIVGAAVAVFLYILFYSPVFAITRIEVNGEAIGASDELTGVLTEQLKETRWHSIAQRNLFGLQSSVLAEKIKNAFTLEGVTVKKHFPHTLILTTTEKPREALWSSHGSYFALDGQGKVLGIVRHQGASEKPVIVDQSGAEPKQDAQVITPVVLSFITQLLTNQTMQSYNPEYVIVKEPLATDIDVVTREGWYAKTDATGDLSDQIDNLDLTIKNTIPPEQRSKLIYIDLRFGKRVYFKLR